MFSFWTILYFLFGFYLLIKSADVFVDGSAGIAKKLKIPKLIVGLTLVAFGTSAPEATVSIIAALQGSADLSVGNIIGSNIVNIAFILGIASLLRTLPVSKGTFFKGVPLCILSSAVLIVIGYDSFFQNHGVDFNILSLGDGILLLFFFIIFLYYIFGDFKSTKSSEHEIEVKEKRYYRHSYWFLGLMIVGGLVGILIGGKLVVDNAVIFARAFGVSETLIGLTIVAFGTSLPELVTSVVAALKNEKDIAVGNIVGSNIFNIFFVLGITSVIIPVNFDKQLVLDAVFSLFVTFVFYFLLLPKKELNRFGGFMLLFLYVIYIVGIVVREFYFSGVFI